jgi:hypothetical protein
MFKVLTATAAAALVTTASAQGYNTVPLPSSSSLPTVDLGYELYRASGFNVSFRHVFLKLLYRNNTSEKNGEIGNTNDSI